jgi:hypothetical protein
MGAGSFYNQNPPTTYAVNGSPSVENPISPIGAMEFICDGSGSTLIPGTFGYLTVPFNCTITSSTLMADQPGSVAVDVRRTTPAAFSPPTHPGAADSLTAAAHPTISSASIAQDAVLTGWTTALNQGDIVGVAVLSATTVTRVTLSLTVQRR